MSGQLSLFGCRDKVQSPGWDDVSKGKAHLVDRIVPCDHCHTHWHDEKCWNTPDRYAYPMNQGDGTCKKHFIEWD